MENAQNGDNSQSLNSGEPSAIIPAIFLWTRNLICNFVVITLKYQTVFQASPNPLSDGSPLSSISSPARTPAASS